jgi:uncharacterized membrane protein YoaK (UPF0700 family)
LLAKARHQEDALKNLTPALLTLNGGYVDTATYLALHGLFSAHVTGNFVTLGTSLQSGGAGATAKLLALPTFCLFVAVARLLGHALRRRGLPAFRSLMAVEAALLAAAALAAWLGPFPDGDSPSAVIVGMTLVAAMAIQNAVHRVHLPAIPPSTIMTSTSTQVMLDLADMVSGLSASERSAASQRLPAMLAAVATFAAGCALAAAAMLLAGMWFFVIPPVVAALVILFAARTSP